MWEGKGEGGGEGMFEHMLWKKKEVVAGKTRGGEDEESEGIIGGRGEKARCWGLTGSLAGHSGAEVGSKAEAAAGTAPADRVAS